MLYRLVVFPALFWCFIASSQTVFQGYTDGEIYVKFKTGALKSLEREDPKNIPVNSLPSFDRLIKKYNVSKINKPFYRASDDEFLSQVYKFHFTNFTQVNSLIEDLETFKEVEYAEKIPLSVIQATPNDFAILSSSVHLNQINAPQAWNIFNGNSNITVAIIDNAVMWSHADLVANTFTNTGETPNNGVDDDGNGYIDDVNGWNAADDDNNAEPPTANQSAFTHGTHCAGIAGARTDNNIGVSSIGWNIKIIPVQCAAETGSGTIIDYGYEGIIYAARTKAKVISLSWGNSGSPSVTEQAVINYAWYKGCIIIAAAGNSSGNNIFYPAAYNHVYAVAAVSPNDVKWGGSSYYTAVDICAPGDNIISTVPYTSTPSYGFSSGTSMATPMVAGLAALMLSRSPNMTQTDVLNCISSTAANIYSLNSSYTGMLGAGRIDAGAAMACAATYSVMPPIANFYASDLFTCPNTPVQFSDSSVYVPTAWSWTFQGGSPATSTLANPVVQYNTSGTYSVALTVTNGAGNSSKTKLSYITVAGPIALPLQEGFQSAQFLPPNWTRKNIGNDTVYWERFTGVGGFGTSSACAVFDNFTWRAALERDEMRTPKYTFNNVAVAKLRFDVAYARYDSYYSDSLEVKMSTNCGATWTQIYLKGGTGLSTRSDYQNYFVPTSTQWRTDSMLLSNVAAQNNVMFSFVNRGHYGQPIYIDNINLFFPSPTVTATYPASICTGQAITYTSTTLGGSTYTWNVGGSVSNGTTATRTYTSPGVYTGTLTAQNGTSISSKTLALTVIANPTLSVSNHTICSGSTATITASGAAAYAWTGGGTNNTLQVTPSATTVYTVTGVNSGICSSSITSTVSVIVTPTVSVANQTVCPGGTATLSATGAGSFAWSNGANTPSIVITPTASAVYTVTGSNSFCSDTRTVSLNLSAPLNIIIVKTQTSTCAGSATTLQAQGASTYAWSNGPTGQIITVVPSTTTTYTVVGTANTCTGSAIITVTTDAPVGPISYSTSPSNPLCVGTTVTITASAAATSYSWSTGSTSNITTVTATPNTTYNLMAFNGGCGTPLQVTLPIAGTSLNITVTSSPPNVCAGQSATLTAQGATSNYTWQGGATGPILVVTPATTSTYIVNAVQGGCSGQSSVAVNVRSLPESGIVGNPTTCLDLCTATINAVTNGGTAPYSYTVSNGVNSICLALPCTNVCQGMFSITTRDVFGCRSNTTFIVNANFPTTATMNVQNNSCGTCSDGSVTVNASGASPFIYSWTPSVSTGSVATNLSSGCYTVEITDANQCSKKFSMCVLTTGLSNTGGINEVKIYPNPAHTYFIAEGSSKFNLKMTDQLGRIVYFSHSDLNKLEIDVTQYAKGIYYLQIENAQGRAVKKIILD